MFKSIKVLLFCCVISTSLACGNNDDKTDTDPTPMVDMGRVDMMDMSQDLSGDMPQDLSKDMPTDGVQEDMVSDMQPDLDMASDVSDDMVDMIEDMSKDMADYTAAADSAKVLYKQWAAVMHNYTCERAFQCQDKWDAVLSVGQHPDITSCKSAEPKVPVFPAELYQSILNGEVSYDANAARACLTALTSTLKTNLCALKNRVEFPPCPAAFVGQQSLDAQCLRDEACAGPETYCQKGANACVGRCQPKLKKNEACTPMTPCESGHSCLFDRQGNGVCVADGAVADDSPCSQDQQCDLASFCGFDNGVRLCKPTPTSTLGAMGDSCTYLTNVIKLCKPGLACIGNMGDPVVGTCRAPIVQGGACHNTAECAPTLRCRVPPQQRVGQCVPFGSVNESCARDYDCQNDLVCSAGQCATPKLCTP